MASAHDCRPHPAGSRLDQQTFGRVCDESLWSINETPREYRNFTPNPWIWGLQSQHRMIWFFTWNGQTIHYASVEFESTRTLFVKPKMIWYRDINIILWTNHFRRLAMAGAALVSSLFCGMRNGSPLQEIWQPRNLRNWSRIGWTRETYQVWANSCPQRQRADTWKEFGHTWGIIGLFEANH